MASPSEPGTVSDGLARLPPPLRGGPVRVERPQRLSGGASRASESAAPSRRPPRARRGGRSSARWASRRISAPARTVGGYQAPGRSGSSPPVRHSAPASTLPCTCRCRSSRRSSRARGPRSTPSSRGSPHFFALMRSTKAVVKSAATSSTTMKRFAAMQLCPVLISLLATQVPTAASRSSAGGTTRSRCAATRCTSARSRSCSPRSRAPRVTLSCTRSQGSRLSCWHIQASRPASGRPSVHVTSPASSGSRPAITRNRLLLPTPLGPRRQVQRPPGRTKSRSRIRNAPS